MTTETYDHYHYLHIALKLAEKRRGFCAPNPAVGAVVVKDGQIIGDGYHWGAGHPHAEVEALQNLPLEQTTGSTVYVTLEPCCMQGRTPACTDLLIKQRVKEVYYGFVDPNPKVSGQGEKQLREAGIACQHLSLPEVTLFYQSYQHWVTTQRPWVTAKLALSLDGKIAGPGGQRVMISGTTAQEFTHHWRKRSDAILTSARTVTNDDPQLNARLPESEYSKPVYVLDRQLTMPLTARVINTAERLTVFYHTGDETKLQELAKLGVQCVPLMEKDGKLDVQQALVQIGEDGVHDLLVEAGGSCFESFALSGSINHAFVFTALKWLGQEAQPAFAHGTTIFQHAKNIRWQAMGEDALCCFEL